MNSDYRIEYYSANSDVSLREFWQRVWLPPPVEKGAAWFPWIVRGNPNTPRGYTPLVLARQGEATVGQLVLMPTLLFNRGRTYSACWGRDMYVEKEHRRNKIASRLCDRWVDDFDVALASGQSPEMLQLQKKYGWTVISQVHQYEKLFFKPRYLANSVKDGVPVAGKRLLAMMYSEAYRLKPSGASGIEVKVGSKFDPRVDLLWSTCKEQYSNICMRDHASLRWRFERHPYTSYTVFEAFDKSGTYRGYSVGRIEGDAAFVIDFLTERGRSGSRVRRVLIHATESHFRKLGVVRMVCRCLSADFETSLRESGYLPTFYTGAMAIKSRLGDFPRDEWYVTAADSDLDR